MQDDLTSTIACNLCGATSVTVLSQRSRSGGPLRTVGCRSCGLVWSDPRPHAARQYYEDEYRLAYKGTFEPKPKHVHRAGLVALSRLEKIRAHLRPRMRALDVGSGGGEFAYLLQTLGHEVQGIEPNRGYAGYAASQYGLNITRGFIGDAALPDGGFDLITIWHVLEHTEDPKSVLAQLGRALAPGGLLVVEVPNVEATCQTPRSSFHEAHLYTFNTVTLQAMAARLGLQTHAITLSDDGGNITAVFRADPAASDSHLPLGDNHERIARTVARHTDLAHLLTTHPYRRLVGRLTRAVAEWIATRQPRSGRERLDRLYASTLVDAGARADRKGTGARWPLWQLVVGGYAAALLFEEVLVDTVLPSHGFSPDQSHLIYAAVAMSIVTAVVWASTVPRTSVQFAALAAWSLPLFALPVYC